MSSFPILTYPALPKSIAREWEALPHDPGNPAWEPFLTSTFLQYEELLGKVCVVPTSLDPYPGGAAEMFEDIRERNTLKVWTGGAPMLPGHPLREGSFNFMFRAVHDYWGHFIPGNDFSPKGEVRAFQSHSKLFPEAAFPALFGETIGQLSVHVVTSCFVKEQKAVCFPISTVNIFLPPPSGETHQTI